MSSLSERHESRPETPEPAEGDRNAAGSGEQMQPSSWTEGQEASSSGSAGHSSEHELSLQIQQIFNDTSDASKANERQNGMHMFSTGFSACAQEAIRYLVEEEGLSPDDPFVAGLEEHLLLQQTVYFMGCLTADPDIVAAMPRALEASSSDSDYSSANEATFSPTGRQPSDCETLGSDQSREKCPSSSTPRK